MNTNDQRAPPLLREAVEGRRALGDQDDERALRASYNPANTLAAQKRWPESIALGRDLVNRAREVGVELK